MDWKPPYVYVDWWFQICVVLTGGALPKVFLAGQQWLVHPGFAKQNGSVSSVRWYLHVFFLAKNADRKL